MNRIDQRKVDQAQLAAIKPPVEALEVMLVAASLSEAKARTVLKAVDDLEESGLCEAFPDVAAYVRIATRQAIRTLRVAQEGRAIRAAYRSR